MKHYKPGGLFMLMLLLAGCLCFGIKADSSQNGSPYSANKLEKTVLGYYTEDYPGDKLSYHSLARNHGLVDITAFFNYLTDGRGNITGQPIRDAMNLAARRNIKTTLMLVHNFHDGKIDRGSVHEVLSKEPNRENFARNILSLIKKNGFDGVNLDLEFVPPGDRLYYNVFLTRLQELFKPYGYLLTVSIPAKTWDNPASPWSGAYDYRFIGQTADLVTLMTYDEHWSDGAPGPIASLPWMRQVLDYAVNNIPKSKILVGVAAYGYDWTPDGAGTVRWDRAEVLAAEHGGAGWDDRYAAPYLIYYDEKGTRHEVWYEDKSSLSAKLDLVNSYNVAGIAIWRLGFEDDDFWDTVSRKLWPKNKKG